MDYKMFFSTIGEDFTKNTSPHSFLNSIQINDDQMPDPKDADIAIFGIEENRGVADNDGLSNAASEIRKKLYELKKGVGSYKVVDLGNLRNGVDHNETLLRVKEVCQMLIEQNTLPLLIGGSHDLDYGQYQSYESFGKLVTILNIDPMLDIDEESPDLSRNHIHKIFLHEPNYLFNYLHLGYQSYLIEPHSLAVLEKLNFEAYRVGEIRQGMENMEPVIRNADMITFDLAAIRHSDAPGSINGQPFGLSGEEACQISWYAGMNEKLTSAGFYNYNPDLDDERRMTASVVATMIWYFVEGFYHRKKEMDFKANDYLKYVVSMPTEPAVINFFKSKQSEKWWMEVPHPGEEIYHRNSVIPCSLSDYETATHGEVPERYIQTISKMN